MNRTAYQLKHRETGKIIDDYGNLALFPDGRIYEISVCAGYGNEDIWLEHEDVTDKYEIIWITKEVD